MPEVLSSGHEPGDVEAPSSVVAVAGSDCGAALTGIASLIPRVVPGLVSKWTGSVTESVIFFGTHDAAKISNAVNGRVSAEQWEDHVCATFLSSKIDRYTETVKFCWKNWKEGSGIDLECYGNWPGGQSSRNPIKKSGILCRNFVTRE